MYSLNKSCHYLGILTTPSNMFVRYDISLIEVCNQCIKTFKHKEPEGFQKHTLPGFYDF